MKRELKPGDRVRFDQFYTGTISLNCSERGDLSVNSFMSSEQVVKTFDGTVTAVKGDAVQVLCDDGRYRAVAASHIRRLTPKPKREWKLAFVDKTDFHRPVVFGKDEAGCEEGRMVRIGESRQMPIVEIIHVAEVRRPRKK